MARKSKLKKHILLPYQQRWVNDPSRFKIWLASRQIGKSFALSLEALIGAIYLDRGYNTARKFFKRKILKKHIDLTQLVKKDPDYKSRVIEWAQKNRVEVVFESKEEHPSDNHSPSFISTILLKGEKKGTGRGDSKKEAEQQAAREALSITQPS